MQDSRIFASQGLIYLQAGDPNESMHHEAESLFYLAVQWVELTRVTFYNSHSLIRVVLTDFAYRNRFQCFRLCYLSVLIFLF